MKWEDLVLDEFCGFKWNNAHSFNHKMFIINTNNTSNGVSFYNGPSFSNEYSKAQFEKANSNLLGVSFQVQKIKFKVGVYGFTIEDYRKLRYWLNEYSISKIVFDFDQNWGYLVKLASVQDSERCFIGCEGEKDLYYTEFDLEFEIQGEPCAISTQGFEFSLEKTSSNIWEFKPKETEVTATYLDTPIIANIGLQYNTSNIDNLSFYAKYYIIEGEGENKIQKVEKVELFKLSLVNLGIDKNSVLNLRYDSETGVMYVQFGDLTKKVLSLMSSNSNGARILNSIMCNKFKLPGKLWFGQDIKVFSFELYVPDGVTLQTSDNAISRMNQTTIECFPRTNVI